MSWGVYANYKAVAGINWPQRIPAHWEVEKLGHLALLRSGGNITSEEIEEAGQYPVYGGNGRRGYTDRYTHDGEFVLIGRQGALCGNINYATGRFWASEHAVVVKPLRCFATKWMGELLRATNLNQYSVSAAQPGLAVATISALRIPVPPLDEQRTIADFLDRETAAIGALIAKKTRFIELLNEKRQALVTHTVTKGLDPNVKMKDSGEKWLEEIPAQWDVVPSNRFFVESKKRAHEEDEHLSATQKYGVIPLAEFERLEGRQVTHAEKNLEQRKHVEVDDFVISMRSFEGGIERVKARGCVRSSYVALVADERAHVGFFSYLFKSSAYIQGLQATAMFIRDGQDLNYNNFRQVKLPFPSTDEQSRIAEFLDREISKSSALLAKTEEAINKLLEYRSALISAAVTGEIDVRNYRPQEAAVLCQ
jgi:type I restriction enzyme S subunit